MEKGQLRVLISVDVPPTLRDRLRELAKRDKRSLPRQVEWILEQYVTKEGK